MRSFAAFVRRDFLRDVQTLPSVMAELFLQPALFLLVFGIVLPKTGNISADFVDILTPGLMIMTAMSSAFLGISVPLLVELHYTYELEDRLAAPVGLSLIALAKMIRATLRSFVGAMAIGLIAEVLADVHIHYNVSLIIAVLLSSICGAGLGLVIADCVDVRNIDAVAALIDAFIIFTGCAQYAWSSLDGLPVFKVAVLLNPLTYGSEFARFSQGVSGESISPIVCLGVLLMMAGTTWVIGCRWFLKLVSS